MSDRLFPAGTELLWQDGAADHGQDESLPADFSQLEPSLQTTPAFFAIWGTACRAQTPISQWKTSPRSPLSVASRPWLSTKQRRARNSPATLAAALVRCAPSPSPRTTRPPQCAADEGLAQSDISEAEKELQARTLRQLEGTWASRQDGKIRGRVEGTRFVWQDDASWSRIAVHSGQKTLSMVVDGKFFSGFLSEDGRLIRWADGDTWIRADDAVSRQLREFCAGSTGKPEVSFRKSLSSHSRPSSRPRCLNGR